MKVSIVIPTINRVDLLEPLLHTLRMQRDEFHNLLVIDNGNQPIKGPSGLDFLTLKPATNLGVAGSWNTGCMSAFSAVDWILFLNDDIDLDIEQLEKINTVLKNNPDKWLIVGPYYWSVFALNMRCVEYLMKTDGYVFDENFFPAYFEDNDFDRRIKLHDPSKILNPCPEMEPKIKRNSMTLAKDPGINQNFDNNKAYYISKWGGEPGKETFTVPFNGVKSE